MGIPPFVEKIRWAQFRNASGFTVPPWGCMGVTSIELSADGEERIYVIERPSTTFRAEYVINGQFAVANGNYGDCTKDLDVLASYDTAATPAYGDGFGPKPSTFLLFKGYPSLFRVEGIFDTTNKIAYGTFLPITTLYGKATAAISANSVATGSKYDIYAGTLGSEADAGFTTVPDAFNRGAAIAFDDPVWLQFGPSGWFIGKMC